ncbi:hypothetical protein CEXT_802601 [Caerostris extrusa]|uniref:Uncharacterized protein n=1 Tax=Caerostris extrusa TaxID=172846 RepID=A0AAV4RYH7_CAEEX|nr:hypothetical protein CEXT_802601 [Caerostris extrusa]
MEHLFTNSIITRKAKTTWEINQEDLPDDFVQFDRFSASIPGISDLEKPLPSENTSQSKSAPLLLFSSSYSGPDHFPMCDSRRCTAVRQLSCWAVRCRCVQKSS